MTAGRRSATRPVRGPLGALAGVPGADRRAGPGGARWRWCRPPGWCCSPPGSPTRWPASPAGRRPRTGAAGRRRRRGAARGRRRPGRRCSPPGTPAAPRTPCAARLLDPAAGRRARRSTAAGGTGPAAVLATTRLHDLGPALATYLPALAQTVVVPPVLLLVLAVDRPGSPPLLVGGHPAAGAAVHGRWSACTPATRTAAAARALDRIAAHVAELVRGLPVLVGAGPRRRPGRRAGRARRDRTAAARWPRCGWRSSPRWCSSCIATLSVALVAVTVGVRLVHGDLALDVGADSRCCWRPRRSRRCARSARRTTPPRTPREAAAEARAVLGRPAPRPLVAEPPRRPARRRLAVTRPDRALPRPRRPARSPARPRPSRPGSWSRCAGPAARASRRVLAVLAGQLLGRRAATVSGAVLRPARRRRRPAVPDAPSPTRSPTSCAGTPGTPGPDESSPRRWPIDGAGLGAARAHLRGRACRTLSPGELQRVALARALVRVRRGARLLLLDEPTALAGRRADRRGRRACCSGCAARCAPCWSPTSRRSPPSPTAPSTSPAPPPPDHLGGPSPPKVRLRRPPTAEWPGDRPPAVAVRRRTPARRRRRGRRAGVAAAGGGARGRRRCRVQRVRHRADRGLRLADRPGRGACRRSSP